MLCMHVYTYSEIYEIIIRACVGKGTTGKSAYICLLARVRAKCSEMMVQQIQSLFS